MKAISLALLALLLSAVFTACMGPRGWPGATVEGDTLFVGTIDGRILALNPEDASLKWGWQPSKASSSNTVGCSGGLATKGGTLYGPPVIAQGIIYTGSFSGQVYAIDVANGLEIWRYNVNSPIVGGMALNNSTLFLGTSAGELHALDISGDYPSEVFTFTVEGAIWSTPVVQDSTVYFGSLDHNLYALDATTGQKKWVFEASGQIVATPLVLGGIVYIGSLDNKLYAVDAGTGEPKWVFEEAGNWFWSNALYSNGIIYAGSLDYYVYAVDAGNGTPVWPEPFKTSGPVYSSPLANGQTLVVASGDGKVYGIDLIDGSEKWQIDTKSKILSSLFAEGNTIYINTQLNGLWAIDGSTGIVIWRVSLGKGEIRKVE